MGFFSNARDLKNIIAFENSPNRANIQEWDCLDDDAIEWMGFFKSKGISPRSTDYDLKRLDIENVFESAMAGNGKTPAAKHSGGNCTLRAVELFNKYGSGKGVPYGAPMREGLRLAMGQKSAYPTKSKPRGCKP
jgi:hypothetical protein